MPSYYYITGTSRGIGLALTQELLRDEAAHVCGIGRTPAPPAANYSHTTLDLSDLESVGRFAFQQHEDAERLVLVNNAGTLAPRFMGKESPEAIIRTYAINVLAPVILMNAFIAAYQPLSIERTICNLSSVAASTAVAGASLYCGTKAALEMTSRVAAVEQQKTAGRFRVISVDPGAVDTDMQATLRESNEEDFPGAARNRQFQQEGRLGDPLVIAQRLARLLRYPSLATSDTVKLGDAAINLDSTR